MTELSDFRTLTQGELTGISAIMRRLYREEGIDKHEPQPDRPSLRLVRRPQFQDIIAVPTHPPEGQNEPMFGGNYVVEDGCGSLDLPGPIRVHDRFE